MGGARGFYIAADHAYTYVGLRGFSLPGNYNARFLAIVDGDVMTDIVLNEKGRFSAFGMAARVSVETGSFGEKE